MWPFELPFVTIVRTIVGFSEAVSNSFDTSRVSTSFLMLAACTNFSRSFAKALTCTQVVYGAFKDERGFNEEDIKEVAKLGRGKAPGGECGALLSARSLSKPRYASQIEKEFKEKAGHTQCKQIRKLGRMDCGGCKALAIELIKKYK